MIALRDNLPLVRFSNGHVMNFESDWLAAALIRAAETAGYKKWWLASHVAESVTRYLQRDFSDNVVTVCRLEKAVRSVLRVIGYADVAKFFRTMPPPVRISLTDIAHQAGHGYELAFFEMLRMHLREAVASSSTVQVELCGLHECVKHLRAAKNWRRDCSGLMEEIVSFVRGEVSISKRAKELHIELT